MLQLKAIKLPSEQTLTKLAASPSMSSHVAQRLVRTEETDILEVEVGLTHEAVAGLSKADQEAKEDVEILDRIVDVEEPLVVAAPARLPTHEDLVSRTVAHNLRLSPQSFRESFIFDGVSYLAALGPGITRPRPLYSTFSDTQPRLSFLCLQKFSTSFVLC